MICVQVCEYKYLLQKADCDERNLDHVPSSTGCENSTTLSLERNHIKQLLAESFLEFNNLENLYMSDNNLSMIQSGTFINMKHLQNLFLSDNDIRELRNDTFVGARSLRRINLNRNSILDIGKHAFHNLSKLVALHLSHNIIQYLQPTVFHGLKNLQRLALDNNALENFDNQTFKGLTQLISLSLHGNKLTQLPNGLFEGLTCVQEIVLSENGLHKLPLSSVLGITSINRLYLDHNDFKTTAIFTSYLRVTHEQLNIGDNPFECDCDFKEIQEWYRNVSQEYFLGTSVMCSIRNVTYNLGNLLPFNCNKYFSTSSHSPMTPVRISSTSDQSLLTNDLLTTQRNDEIGCNTTGWKIATALLSLYSIACTFALILLRAEIIQLFQNIYVAVPG
ncbi:Leucine-rich repeat-containing protein 15 [Holothuria leucospilota]|uniref:Leucine-rich repeat-containing protein 15 n=1 Tax=Holothuria leucospilota TaxID=206669 RepID=A0A9Q1BG72_HOLLE|nr:Leucine-rich repeat-containing protein 15 [Holothuria leucospilota]